MTSSPGLTSSLLKVGGLENIVAQFNERVYLPLVVAPAAVDRLGIPPPKGVLLHGPPGCGESLLATRVANILTPTKEPKIVQGPEVLSSLWGKEEERVRELFEPPETGFQVVILDEAEVLLQRRGSEIGHRHIDRIVSQFLSCMDGAAARMEEETQSMIKGKVIFLATTNDMKSIDPAILRLGRFE